LTLLLVGNTGVKDAHSAFLEKSLDLV
jgi:hypothetical protein